LRSAVPMGPCWRSALAVWTVVQMLRNLTRPRMPCYLSISRAFGENIVICARRSIAATTFT
jgi:hypothetical protein